MQLEADNDCIASLASLVLFDRKTDKWVLLASAITRLVIYLLFCPHVAGLTFSSSVPSHLQFRTYSDCFAEALVMEAEKDRDIVVVHAGMHMDPSLQVFQERFPDKFFDVGMAEQHAVTFSAGLSCGGLKPFCIIPSAFLQRAYDQVLFSLLSIN